VLRTGVDGTCEQMGKGAGEICIHGERDAVKASARVKDKSGGKVLHCAVSLQRGIGTRRHHISGKALFISKMVLVPDEISLAMSFEGCLTMDLSLSLMRMKSEAKGKAMAMGVHMGGLAARCIFYPLLVWLVCAGAGELVRLRCWGFRDRSWVVGT